MTTRILDRFPIEEVNERARDTHFWRTVALWLAASIYAVGWVAAQICRVVWFAVAWIWAALALGFRDGRNRRRDE